MSNHDWHLSPAAAPALSHIPVKMESSRIPKNVSTEAQLRFYSTRGTDGKQNPKTGHQANCHLVSKRTRSCPYFLPETAYKYLRMYLCVFIPPLSPPPPPPPPFSLHPSLSRPTEAHNSFCDGSDRRFQAKAGHARCTTIIFKF